MIEVRQACHPWTADRRRGFMGGSLRTVQRRGERSERFTGLYPFEHRPTLIYNMLRSSVTRHFSSQSGFFFFLLYPWCEQRKSWDVTTILKIQRLHLACLFIPFLPAPVGKPGDFRSSTFYFPPFPLLKKTSIGTFLRCLHLALRCHIRSFTAALLFYECFSRSIP